MTGMMSLSLLLALLGTLFVPNVHAVTCGAGTVYDEASDTCIVDQNTDERDRRQDDNARINTENGDLLVSVGNGNRFAVTKPDGSTTYIDENINTVAGAIKLGYDLSRDLQDVYDLISLGDTLRSEIGAVANESRVERNALVDTIRTETQITIQSANETLMNLASGVNEVATNITQCADRGMILSSSGTCVNPIPTCPSTSRITVRNGSLAGFVAEPITGVQEWVECDLPNWGPQPSVIQCRSNGTWSTMNAACIACSTLARNSEGRPCKRCRDGRCLEYSILEGSQIDPARDCLHLKRANDAAGQTLPNGLYWIRPTNRGDPYQVYCDMQVDGGGWTLINSVYETNVGAKRAGDDRWTTVSSGPGPNNWMSANSFGSLNRAASDDFKSKAYGEINASNLMIWHVNENVETDSLYENARFRYYTSNNFFASMNPPNMRGVFTGTRRLVPSGRGCGGRLVVPTVWDTNNANEYYSTHMSPNWMRHNAGSNGRNKIEFSSGTDHTSSIFAVCPGSSAQSSCGNHEHACIGGVMTGDNRWISDFSATDWNGIRCSSCSGYEWSTSGFLQRNPVIFFAR